MGEHLREDVPHVILENKYIRVIYKPPGWTVTVNSGRFSHSDECALESKDQPIQNWIASTFGASSAISRDPSFQYGLVHRLDRDTSGALLCATSYAGYYMAEMQFVTRRVLKEYICLCHGKVPKKPTSLRAPLRHVQFDNGSEKSVIDTDGKPAHTEILRVAHVTSRGGCPTSVVLIRIHSGRRHQIRAHLSAEGHPLVGDVQYGGQTSEICSRMFLHAYRLCLEIGSDQCSVVCPLPRDLTNGFALLVYADQESKSFVRSIPSK